MAKRVIFFNTTVWWIILSCNNIKIFGIEYILRHKVEIPPFQSLKLIPQCKNDRQTSLNCNVPWKQNVLNVQASTAMRTAINKKCTLW